MTADSKEDIEIDVYRVSEKKNAAIKLLSWTHVVNVPQGNKSTTCMIIVSTGQKSFTYLPDKKII